MQGKSLQISKLKILGFTLQNLAIQTTRHPAFVHHWVTILSTKHENHCDLQFSQWGTSI